MAFLCGVVLSLIVVIVIARLFQHLVGDTKSLDKNAR